MSATTAVVFATYVRNLTWFQKCDRDLWSAICRFFLVLWAITIVWRIETVCQQSVSILSMTFQGAHCRVSDIRYYGVAQIAFYVSEAVWICRNWHRKRKDDELMLWHHCTTIGLILYWGVYNHLYVLATILPSLHDCTDIFLDSAKYIGRLAKQKRFQRWKSWLLLSKDILFGLFVALWTAIRIVYIPLFVLPTLYNASDRHRVPHAIEAFSALCLLQIAQIYWSVLIFKAVANALRGEKLQDDRE